MNRSYDTGGKGIRVGGPLPEEILDDDPTKVVVTGKAHVVVEGTTLEDAGSDELSP